MNTCHQTQCILLSTVSTSSLLAQDTMDLPNADTTTGENVTESAEQVVAFEKIGGHTSFSGVAGATAANVKLVCLSIVIRNIFNNKSFYALTIMHYFIFL